MHRSSGGSKRRVRRKTKASVSAGFERDPFETSVPPTHVGHDHLEPLVLLADQVLDGDLDVLLQHPQSAHSPPTSKALRRRTSNVKKVVPAQCWPLMYMRRRVTPSPLGMRRNEMPWVSPALPEVRTAAVK